MIRERTGLDVAASLGILTAEQARRLADAGLHRYNHNLETARSFFPQVVTTHTWEERFDTCRLVRETGMELCCGAILGMGETDDQRLELLAELREVDPAEVPLNFLNPRPGTPLGGRPLVEPMEAIRWIALFRLALPAVTLRYAGGREVTLRELQALGLTSGINALIVGNYLTTLGPPAGAGPPAAGRPPHAGGRAAQVGPAGDRPGRALPGMRAGAVGVRRLVPRPPRPAEILWCVRPPPGGAGLPRPRGVPLPAAAAPHATGEATRPAAVTLRCSWPVPTRSVEGPDDSRSLGQRRSLLGRGRHQQVGDLRPRWLRSCEQPLHLEGPAEMRRRRLHCGQRVERPEQRIPLVRVPRRVADLEVADPGSPECPR